MSRRIALPSPPVTVEARGKHKSGGFAVIEAAGTDSEVEQCRHRSHGQAEKCARNQCASRYAFLYRRANPFGSLGTLSPSETPAAPTSQIIALFDALKRSLVK